MGLSALLENQLGHLSKFQKLHIYRYSISTSGSKLSLFSFYGQQFLRYVPIFKIAIFRHETWSLTKVPEVGHILSFHPREVKIELIFALWAVVSEIRADFQNCHIRAWNLPIGQSARRYTISYFINYPRVPNFTPFCSAAAHFKDIGSFAFSHWPQC